MWYRLIKTREGMWQTFYCDDDSGGYYLVAEEIGPEDFIKGCPAGVKALLQLKDEFTDPKCLGVVVAGDHEMFMDFSEVKQEHQRGDVLPGMVTRLNGMGGR